MQTRTFDLTDSETVAIETPCVRTVYEVPKKPDDVMTIEVVSHDRTYQVIITFSTLSIVCDDTHIDYLHFEKNGLNAVLMLHGLHTGTSTNRDTADAFPQGVETILDRIFIGDPDGMMVLEISEVVIPLPPSMAMGEDDMIRDFRSRRPPFGPH